MAIYSNKAKPTKKSKGSKISAPDKMDETCEVRKISNGFIVKKSYRDKEYNYKSEETYYDKDPIAGK